MHCGHTWRGSRWQCFNTFWAKIKTSWMDAIRLMRAYWRPYTHKHLCRMIRKVWTSSDKTTSLISLRALTRTHSTSTHSNLPLRSWFMFIEIYCFTATLIVCEKICTWLFENINHCQELQGRKAKDETRHFYSDTIFWTELSSHKSNVKSFQTAQKTVSYRDWVLWHIAIVLF